jgi:UDP-3-O-[3-hydroxymyristoyl] glucosamine N-acyltransferase
VSFTVAQLAEIVGGQVVGDASLPITGFAPADAAQAGHLTFAESPAYLTAAEASHASAVLVPASFSSASKVLIRVANPRVAMARLLPHFFPPVPPPAGIDPSSTIAPSAQIDPTASIGPGCVIGDRVRIGARCVLRGGNHLGADTRLGEDVELFAHVVLYPRTQVGNRVAIHASTVIGSDGYGYVLDEGKHRKVLHLGNVVIHDDVEIGANAAIDRGALGSTIIGQGTKIDNLVHVAHNVVMGRHCLILGQVGFAGSTRLGDYCVIAAQAGIAGHLKLGPQATVGAKSGVMRDVGERETVLGIPAQPDRQTKRQWIATQQLPDVIRRLRDLEKQVAALTAAAAATDPAPADAE